MKIKFRANLQPKAQKWTRVEIECMLKLYPLYKAGNQRYTAGVLRGNLKNRTLDAIRSKYWAIMGSEHKKKININQRYFDFFQDKITRA